MNDDPPPAVGVRRTNFLLNVIERVGNRLPDPLVLFAGMAVAVPLFSAFAVAVGWERAHPVTGETIRAVNLLAPESLRRILTGAVGNFASFPPLAIVLVSMLGVGLAERSGFIAAGLRALVSRTPRPCLAPALVFSGVLANLATDAGYVVLVPLGAVVFASVGRHPIAGLCAAFAGVSGGFSANLVITPLDPLLSGLTEAAARLYDPAATVPPTANYYFMIASTFIVVAAGWWVTERIVEPRLGPWNPKEAAPVDAVDRTNPADAGNPDPALAKRGLLEACGAAALALLATLALFVPRGSLLRGPDGGLQPFYEALIPLLAAIFVVPGLVFGIRVGAIRRSADVARMLSETMAGMGGYIVLAFFAAQFIAYFQWSNLGLLIALTGADALRATGAGPVPLLLGIVLLSACVNLFIGSASAKWALLAPILVPMMMTLGFSPDFAQAAFRVGDSCTNTITPLLPYFPVILAFARRHDSRIGLGTLVSAMLPYAIAFAIVWSALLAAWFVLGWPLGPGPGSAVGA
jgi:aminobenzoyl-glutamate transport protein